MRTRLDVRSPIFWGALAALLFAGCSSGSSGKKKLDSGVLADAEVMEEPDMAPPPPDLRPVDMAKPDVAPDTTPDATPDTSPDTTPDAQPDTMPDAGTDAMADAGTDAASCMSACTLGDKRCGPGGGLQSCVMTGGCANWAAESACPTNQACTGTGMAAKCDCKPAPAGCSAEGKFCLNGTTEAVCAKDGNGCFYQTTMTTCGANQTCKMSGTPGCSCDNSCAMGDVGSYCKDAKTVATCAESSGCFLSSAPVVCTGAKVCVRDDVMKMAACQCPAMGNKTGDGCMQGTAESCDGNNIVACVADPMGSGCYIWAVKKDCGTDAAGPLTCGTKSGAAACQCAEPTTEITVDPIAGSDAAMGLFPTGAAQPAACRYQTLTKGLTALAGTTIKKVTATGGADGAPAMFSGETFPLVVPDGVALGTSDATPTPANYKVAFNGASASALTLGNGASLSGLSLSNAGGAASALGISCTTGSVSLTGVALEGTSGGSTMAAGLAVGVNAAGTDTCTATLSKVSVSGFVNGLSVATAGAAGVSLSEVTIVDNDVGLLVAAGPVTASKLTVTKSGGGTATRGVVLRGVANATAPAFTGSEVTISNMTVNGVQVETPANTAAPTLSLTGGEVSGAGQDGINLAGGTLSLGGTNVHNNGDDGLEVATGTINLGAGTKLDANGGHGLWVKGGTVTATGVSASSNTSANMGTVVDGVLVVGGTVTLHQMTLNNNKNRGLAVDGGSVVLDDGSVVKQNGADNASSGIRFTAGSLKIGAADSGQVEIAENGLHGLNLDTAMNSNNGSVVVTRTLVHDNAGDGVNVLLDGAGNTLSMSASEVYKNARSNLGNASSDAGIVVRKAPSNGVNAIILDGLQVRENGRGGQSGVGIYLRGDKGDVTASILNCAIHDNGDYGLLVEQDNGNSITRETVQGNDIYNNNTTANRAAGGVYFSTSSTLSSFTGNKVHGNGGDEIGINATPNGGTTWTLQPPTATCDAMANQIYCYGSGKVGINVTSNMAVTVNANNTSWANGSPSLGVDFATSGGSTVTFNAPCGAKACQ